MDEFDPVDARDGAVLLGKGAGVRDFVEKARTRSWRAGSTGKGLKIAGPRFTEAASEVWPRERDHAARNIVLDVVNRGHLFLPSRNRSAGK